jgi:hypothetical protein
VVIVEVVWEAAVLWEVVAVETWVVDEWVGAWAVVWEEVWAVVTVWEVVAALVVEVTWEVAWGAKVWVDAGIWVEAVGVTI